DQILTLARSIGAEPVADAQERAWGGYSGYFADPDGFRWEIAVNPGPIGQIVLPPARHLSNRGRRSASRGAAWGRRAPGQQRSPDEQRHQGQGGQQSYEVPHLVVGHDGDELAQRRTGHEVEGGAPADRLVLVPELPGQLGGTEGVVP